MKNKIDIASMSKKKLLLINFYAFCN